MSAAAFPLDPDPIPARPTPADLDRVPVEEVAEAWAVFADGADRRDPARRADGALYALAAGESVVARILAERARLTRVALAADASPRELAAALGRTAADPLDTLTGGAR